MGSFRGENGGLVLGTLVLKEVVLGHGFNFHENIFWKSGLGEGGGGSLIGGSAVAVSFLLLKEQTALLRPAQPKVCRSQQR